MELLNIIGVIGFALVGLVAPEFCVAIGGNRVMYPSAKMSYLLWHLLLYLHILFITNR
jgi:hypothetical protein